MRAFVDAACAALVGFVLLAGCGSGRPPPAGESSGAVGPSPQAGGGDGSGDAGTKPPGCGQKDDGSYCDCVDVPLFAEAPNIYFVLDRSGSMADDGKWSRVRGVVAQVLRGLGPRANFGATVFPGPQDDACAPPREVMSIRPGDPPGADGPTTKHLLQVTAPGPSGGTPTSEALRFVLPKLRAASGKTFVILATDGAPNCNPQTACGYDKCMANIEDVPGCPSAGPLNCCEPPYGTREACLDGDATSGAVAALASAGFPVYVVGIPGSARYGSLLDDLAVKGGTALSTSPRYYKIETSTDSAILATLKKVAAKIVATCTFELKEPPAAPDLVNVYLDEQVLPKDPVNGWSIEGKTVTVLGTACDRLLAGEVLGVRIIAGCPTINPR